MDKEMTVFEELARMYENGTSPATGACSSIRCLTGQGKFDEFFEFEFKPDIEEQRRYDHNSTWWLSESYGVEALKRPISEADTNMRIMALLFADIIWREEVLGEDVYG